MRASRRPQNRGGGTGGGFTEGHGLLLESSICLKTSSERTLDECQQVQASPCGLGRQIRAQSLKKEGAGMGFPEIRRELLVPGT